MANAQKNGHTQWNIGAIFKLRSLQHVRLTETQMIIAVAFFVAVSANTGFMSSALELYPLNSATFSENLPLVASLFVYIVATFTALLLFVCHRFLVKPLLVAFLLLSSVIAYFTNRLGIIVDHRMIENVLQTDLSEAADLVTMPLVSFVAALGIFPSVLVAFVPLARPSWKNELYSRSKLIGAAMLVMLAIFFTFSAHYTSMFRMQRALWAQVNPTTAIFSVVKLAKNSLKARSSPHLFVGVDAKTPPNDPDRELVIMVVGETARADHFSLNGYERETNPLLKKENVVNFPNFWSCGTSTAHSVPCMFSHYGRTEFEKPEAKAADNALDILKRAGVNVLWRDNNSSSKGVADRVTYEHFMSPEKNTICDPECRDEGMLVGLQEFIDGHPSGDILIVLHTMGNHGPAYYKRYPKRFEKFTPVCKSNDMGSCEHQEIINAYDNAILYTDYILSKVIELLKHNDDGFETAMFYASDHGESLGENGLYLHGMPYFIAPDAQKHVPAVMWFGKNFDSEPLAKLAARRLEQLSHDNIFSTLIGLFEIRTEAYDVTMDILDHSKPEHW